MLQGTGGENIWDMNWPVLLPCLGRDHWLIFNIFITYTMSDMFNREKLKSSQVFTRKQIEQM